MEAERFDWISKAVGDRRRLLAGLMAAVGSAFASAEPAGGKRRKKKKKGRCYSHNACPLGELCKGGRC